MSAVKVCILRWLLTAASELGMRCSQWVDRCQASLDELREGANG